MKWSYISLLEQTLHTHSINNVYFCVLQVINNDHAKFVANMQWTSIAFGDLTWNDPKT